MPRRPQTPLGVRHRRDILIRAEAALVEMYGRPEDEPLDEPIDCLVGTILSQNTSRANSSAGFENLKRRFATWEAVADAATVQVTRAIEVSGLGRGKGPRIQAALRRLRSERGRVTLDHLAVMPVARAYDYLLAFDGVGPKTALCVLLFALGRAVFPVDTHIYRIAMACRLTAPTRR